MHDFLTANVGRAFPCQANDDVESYMVLADLKIILRRRMHYSHVRHQAKLVKYGWLSDEQREIIGNAGANRFVAIRVQTSEADVTLFGYGVSNERFESIPLIAYPSEQVFALLSGNSNGDLQPASRLSTGWAMLGDSYSPSPHIVSVDHPIEPTCLTVTNEVGPQEAVTYLYNQPLTQYTSPLGCLPVENGAIPDGYVLACEPKTGTIKLVAGNQSSIRQDPYLGELILSADGSHGDAGRSCDPVPLSKLDGEQLDTDTAPRCNEVIRGVNGISGPEVGLYGFNGVRVRTLPDQHRIIIGAANREAEDCDALTLGSEPEVETIEDIASQCDQIDPTFDPAQLPFAVSGKNQGICQFRSTPNHTWELINGGCESPYVCHQPDFVPTEAGQIVRTPCIELIASEIPIINPYFDDLVDFNGWDHSPNATIQRRPDSYLEASHLPAAKLYGGDWLRQRRIPVTPGDYVLQADLLMLSGRFEFSVVASNTGTVIFTHVYSTENAAYHTAAFDPRSINVHLVDLYVRYIGGGDPTYISFFALTLQ